MYGCRCGKDQIRRPGFGHETKGARLRAAKLSDRSRRDRGERGKQALTEGPFVCVMIGAGFAAPEHTVLFEKVINIIHSDAPAARLCFNTHPGNTPEAVQRVA